MISFMVLAGPRSATTWAANWLTTDTTLCLHDPLLEYKLEDLEKMTLPNGRKLGIACTSSLLHSDWVNGSRAKKIILYRDVKDINRSLGALGLTELNEKRHYDRVMAIKNVKLLPYEQLFSPKAARAIAKYLDVPFDVDRHDLLRQMRIEPMWRHLNIGKQAIADLVQRVKEAY